MEFIPLQIATIVPNKKITFDLYIHFKEQYIVYAQTGTKIPPEKLSKLALQQIARFYLTKEHEGNYQAFLDAILTEALASSKTPLAEKVELTEGAAATGIEAMQNEATPAAYKITQKAAKSLREVIEQNPDALKKIYGKASDSTMGEVIRHCLNVCALCTKLGRKMGIGDAELDEMGTAALLHDIGLTKMAQKDRPLFNKPKKLFTPDDHRIYKFHPIDSAKMLADRPYVTPEIIELVRHHDENNSGTGPLKLKKITLNESILSICNNYDKRVFTQKITPKQALKDLQIEEVGNYDIKLIKTLAQVLSEEGLLD